MVERLIGPRAAHHLLFLVLAALVFAWRLLPQAPSYGGLPGPDILLGLVLCWTLRRPEYMPFWLVALVIFIEDLLLLRPPGLWAALSVAGSEFLRSRVILAREMPFGAEWLLVATTMLAMALANRLVYGIAMLPQMPLETASRQLLVSVILYPALVGLSVLVFGLRRPLAGDAGPRGRRP